MYERVTMPKTRKAAYCLGCLDGTVFMDFDITKDNLIYLKRISFDGYGCCELKHYKTLDKKDSSEFIKEITANELNENNISSLVKKIIKLNQEYIWQDALAAFQLL